MAASARTALSAGPVPDLTIRIAPLASDSTRTVRFTSEGSCSRIGGGNGSNDAIESVSWHHHAAGDDSGPNVRGDI
jgi:hypothetical protein